MIKFRDRYERCIGISLLYILDSGRTFQAELYQANYKYISRKNERINRPKKAK